MHTNWKKKKDIIAPAGVFDRRYGHGHSKHCVIFYLFLFSPFSSLSRSHFAFCFCFLFLLLWFFFPLCVYHSLFRYYFICSTSLILSLSLRFVLYFIYISAACLLLLLRLMLIGYVKLCVWLTLLQLLLFFLMCMLFIRNIFTSNW